LSRQPRGWRAERELRRQCRSQLRTLGIRMPLDIHDMAARLAEQRGKPIKLIAAPLPLDGPSGCWLPTKSSDYVWYQQCTTPNRQRQIVLHEFWHMVARHEACGVTVPAAMVTLMSNVSADTVTKMLGRSGYDEGREWAAEAAATIINRWCERFERSGAPAYKPHDAGWIESALEGRPGWL